MEKMGVLVILLLLSFYRPLTLADSAFALGALFFMMREEVLGFFVKKQQTVEMTALENRIVFLETRLKDLESKTSGLSAAFFKRS